MLKRKLKEVAEAVADEEVEEIWDPDDGAEDGEMEHDDQVEKLGHAKGLDEDEDIEEDNDQEYDRPSAPVYLQTPAYTRSHAVADYQRSKRRRISANVPTPPRKSITFSAQEQPRSIGGIGTTPSWFRYANIDGPSQDYAPMPKGYDYEVQYYRREDGVVSTVPALAPISVPGAPKQLTMRDITRVVDVQNEITDEGIEDESSDEELYPTRRVTASTRSTSIAQSSVNSECPLSSKGSNATFPGLFSPLESSLPPALTISGYGMRPRKKLRYDWAIPSPDDSGYEGNAREAIEEGECEDMEADMESP